MQRAWIILNHPHSSWSVEKLSSMKPVPGAKKVGDLWAKEILGICVTLGSHRRCLSGRWVRQTKDRAQIH